jgi:hypothetical protein
MSSVIQFLWKVWLRLNLLTPDVDNDYVGEVSTTGRTIRNTEIAAAIVEEGSEIKFDTIISILQQRDRIVRHKLQEGCSVQDGVSRISPRVSGVWHGQNAKFDPATHRITVDMSAAPELREALTRVGVEVLGVKEGGGIIGLVTDAATGKIDGTVTRGDDIIITGEKIRIAPDNTDPYGVFVRSSETGEAHRITHRLVQNDPKKVIARLPNVPAGLYTLEIVTRFCGGGRLLNEARTITYDVVLNLQ